MTATSKKTILILCLIIYAVINAAAATLGEFEIAVQVHHVAFGCYHSSILIIPKDQAKYEKDPRFKNSRTINGTLYRYATIGSSFGKWNGRLVSNINRPTDINLSTKVEFASVDLSGDDVERIILKLFEADSNYQDNLDYDIFPAATREEQKWYIADDSYNSNSYVAGLLTALNLKPPQLTNKVPGYNKPVPASHFQPR